MRKQLLLFLSLFILAEVKAQDDIAATFSPSPSFDYNVTANSPSPNNGVDSEPINLNPITLGGITMRSYNVLARRESSDGSALYRYLNFGSNFNTTNKDFSIEFTSTSDIKQITLLFRGGGATAAAQPVVYAGADEATAVIINSGEAGYITGFPSGAGLAPGRYSSGVFPDGIKYVRIVRTAGQTLRIYRILANTAAFTLPLDFLSFTAKPSALGNAVNLNWKTTNEVNTKNFEVQSRTANTEFKTIGLVRSKNTSGVHNYAFTDDKPAASTLYYRLKQIDNDGKFKYSDVVAANVKPSLSVTVYPNPVSTVLTVNHSASANRLRITNLQGRKVVEQAIAANTISTEVNVANLNAGTYIVVIEGLGGKTSTKFIKR